MAEHESLVTVGTFTTVGEAEAVRLLLESRGIACFLADAELVTMNWALSNAVGGVKGTGDRVRRSAGQQDPRRAHRAAKVTKRGRLRPGPGRGPTPHRERPCRRPETSLDAGRARSSQRQG